MPVRERAAAALGQGRRGRADGYGVEEELPTSEEEEPARSEEEPVHEVAYGGGEGMRRYPFRVQLTEMVPGSQEALAPLLLK